ncbi:MAG TPA: acylphosphatase [Candidatus Binataceae bacterium]|jgi:acylphosphatase|nr:acylphosphatase [Candidatus Binataceae bacterium]
MAQPDLARLRMLVHGRVQGVFFRHSTAEQAHALGLAGWVRNLPDGDVEIVAEGPRRELKILAAWAHQGPRLARVESVEEQWSQPHGESAGFTIR